MYVYRLFFFIIALPLMPIIFQNCGGFSTKSMNTVSGSCATDLQPVFQNTYHSFFKVNSCNECHSTEGLSGIPHFADNNISVAYPAFLPSGPAGIDGKLAEGHQAYDYQSLKDELQTHSDTWEAANSSCSSKTSLVSQGQKLTFFTNIEEFGHYKVLQDASGNPTNTKQTITFDFSQSPFSQPIEGASLSFDIEVKYNDFLFPDYYIVSNPLFTSTSETIRLEGLTILLNGQTYQVTTYTAIEELIRPSSTAYPLDPDGADALFVKDTMSEVYTNDDEWSVQFDVLEVPQN